MKIKNKKIIIASLVIAGYFLLFPFYNVHISKLIWSDRSDRYIKYEVDMEAGQHFFITSKNKIAYNIGSYSCYINNGDNEQLKG